MASRKNIEPLHSTLRNDLLEWERNTGKPFFKILNGTNFFLACHLEIERERSHAVPIAGDLASVVQKVDSAIHRINHYPADKHCQKQLSYPLDSDLSGG